jgi:hypothetical protein
LCPCPNFNRTSIAKGEAKDSKVLFFTISENMKAIMDLHSGNGVEKWRVQEHTAAVELYFRDGSSTICAHGGFSGTF